MHSVRSDNTGFAERSSKAISERPWALNFRVLLRLRVRTLTVCFTTQRGRCSPDLPPLRGKPTQPLGKSPPPMRLDEHISPTASRPRDVAICGATGYQSDRAWDELQRVPPTPMRSSTLPPACTADRHTGEPGTRHCARANTRA